MWIIDIMAHTQPLYWFSINKHGDLTDQSNACVNEVYTQSNNYCLGSVCIKTNESRTNYERWRRS